jgi:hypothetical protein
MQEIAYTFHTFKGGGTNVAYFLEFEISSCGVSNENARRNIQDAVKDFLSGNELEHGHAR